jgi:hypothetical protein
MLLAEAVDPNGRFVVIDLEKRAIDAILRS